MVHQIRDRLAWRLVLCVGNCAASNEKLDESLGMRLEKCSE